MTENKLYRERALLSRPDRKKFRRCIDRFDKSDETVCYSASGEPLTHKQALAAIQEAIDEVDRGETVPMEEVMKSLDEEFDLR